MTTIVPAQDGTRLGVLAAIGALFALAASLIVIYLVQFDAGQLSQSGILLHEIMHDGRHLLGVPCH